MSDSSTSDKFLASFSFSIVIPTYNRASSLRLTLQSILQAEESSLLREIVVVDDGSTDETRSIVESFGERVCYERTERKGPAIARNHGAGHASASHVLFFDDDLIVPTNYLRDLKRIHQSVACDWIAGNIKTASTLPDSSFVRFLKDFR